MIASNARIDGSLPGSFEVDSETTLLGDGAGWLTPPSVGDPSTFMLTPTTATSCEELAGAALPPAPPPDFGACSVLGC